MIWDDLCSMYASLLQLQRECATHAVAQVWKKGQLAKEKQMEQEKGNKTKLKKKKGVNLVDVHTYAPPTD